MGRRFGAVRRSYQEIDVPQGFLLEAKGFPNAALESIPFDGLRRMFFRHEDAQPRTAALARFQEERVTAEMAALAMLQQVLEARFLGKPPGRAEPEALARRG